MVVCAGGVQLFDLRRLFPPDAVTIGRVGIVEAVRASSSAVRCLVASQLPTGGGASLQAASPAAASIFAGAEAVRVWLLATHAPHTAGGVSKLAFSSLLGAQLFTLMSSALF